MTERTQAEAGVGQSAGALSVRGDGPASSELNFLVGQQSKRLGPSLLTAAALDVVVFILFVVISRSAPTPAPKASLPDNPNDQIIWIAEPGPGGGGGGGGNLAKEPPKQAVLPGKDKISVPVIEKPEMQIKADPPPPEPEPIQQVNIPVRTLGAETELLPGAIDAPSAPVASSSLGSGVGGGAGTGQGTGLGSGQGSGLGDGIGGGTGGGVYKPGNGVTTPVPIRQVTPVYSTDAMRARVQGEVLVQCVVQLDGTVSDLRVVRSLGFGLDEEAIKAARQWRFQPGTRFGQPVKVEVLIGLSFSLR